MKAIEKFYTLGVISALSILPLMFLLVIIVPFALQNIGLSGYMEKEEAWKLSSLFIGVGFAGTGVLVLLATLVLVVYIANTLYSKTNKEV